MAMPTLMGGWIRNVLNGHAPVKELIAEMPWKWSLSFPTLGRLILKTRQNELMI